ncbi:hypothetical protein F53441_8298 [Fusarium austroafricanum]|uniref:Uncharacterized protein n=1 Tax=Fusarium austroafricanum TaxID=2364996 RepID=A0A8H4KEG2_9HYPO|nr:hypothetical protein F53441_8298 [Fusarium austroafricanum]
MTKTIGLIGSLGKGLPFDKVEKKFKDIDVKIVKKGDATAPDYVVTRDPSSIPAEWSNSWEMSEKWLKEMYEGKPIKWVDPREWNDSNGTIESRKLPVPQQSGSDADAAKAKAEADAAKAKAEADAKAKADADAAKAKAEADAKAKAEADAAKAKAEADAKAKADADAKAKADADAKAKADADAKAKADADAAKAKAEADAKAKADADAKAKAAADEKAKTGNDNEGNDNEDTDKGGSNNEGTDNEDTDKGGSNNEGTDNEGNDNEGSNNGGSDNEGTDKGGNNKPQPGVVKESQPDKESQSGKDNQSGVVKEEPKETGTNLSSIPTVPGRGRSPSVILQDNAKKAAMEAVEKARLARAASEAANAEAVRAVDKANAIGVDSVTHHGLQIDGPTKFEIPGECREEGESAVGTIQCITEGGYLLVYEKYQEYYRAYMFSGSRYPTKKKQFMTYKRNRKEEYTLQCEPVDREHHRKPEFSIYEIEIEGIAILYTRSSRIYRSLITVREPNTKEEPRRRDILLLYTMTSLKAKYGDSLVTRRLYYELLMRNQEPPEFWSPEKQKRISKDEEAEMKFLRKHSLAIARGKRFVRITEVKNEDGAFDLNVEEVPVLE